MAIFDALGDFMALLFSKDPAAAKERRELRQIRQSLRMQKPAIYRTAGNMVLPGFANVLYELVIALKPFRDLFFRSIFLADARMAQRFRDSVIESRLSAGERQLLADCGYETLMERIFSHPEPDAAIADADADFQAVAKALENRAIKSLDADLADFDRFTALCRYDSGRLLKAFDPAANPESSAYRPKFVAADGLGLVPELLDLYSVAANFRLGASVVLDAANLAERLGDGAAEDLRRKLQKPADRMNKLLASTLSAGSLTAMARAICGQSAYAMPAAAVGVSGVADYRERIAARWRATKERAQREVRERALGTDISACFGAPPNGGLLTLDGINEDLANRVAKESGRSFAWLTPLRVLKSIEGKLERNGWFEATRRIAVEGFFNNAVIRARITDAVGRLDKADARIAAFEEAVSGQGRASAVALRRALDDAAKGKDPHDSVNRIMTAIDSRAKDLVEQDTAALRSLAEAVYDILADSRKGTPDIVTNIRTLAAAKDKALIPSLVQGYNDIMAFLKIMKAYIIVVPINGATATSG